MQALWEHKTLYQRKEFLPEEFYDRAIWAEFGKIVYFGRLFYHQRGHS
jgi:hypothetical protein